MEGSNILDEVLVTGRKRSKAFLRRQEYLDRYMSIVPRIGEYSEVPIRENLKSFNDNLMRYLEFFEGIKIIHTDAGENYLIARDRKEILLYVDGRRIHSEEIPGLDLAMTDVDNIMRLKLPVDLITPQQYQVFTKPNFRNGIKERFTAQVSLAGYDRPKKYRSAVHNLKPKLQEIDWKPNMRIEAGEAIIMISKSAGSKKPIFQIQGFSNEGILISEIISLD